MSQFIYETLVADPTVGGLVGVRVFPDQVPVNAPLPCVVYHVIDGPSDTTHDGATGLAEGRVQFDCWGQNTDLDSEALARAVRLALVGKRIGPIQFGRKVSERSMPPDPTLLKRRHVLDLSIWHSEDV